MVARLEWFGRSFRLSKEVICSMKILRFHSISGDSLGIHSSCLQHPLPENIDSGLFEFVVEFLSFYVFLFGTVKQNLNLFK